MSPSKRGVVVGLREVLEMSEIPRELSEWGDCCSTFDHDTVALSDPQSSQELLPNATVFVLEILMIPLNNLAAHIVDLKAYLNWTKIVFKFSWSR